MFGYSLTARSTRGGNDFSRRLLEMLAAEQLGDLHGVQRRALPEIVGDAPQAEAVVDCRVLAHAADIGGIFADALDRRDVAAVLPLIDQHDAGRLAQYI